MLVAAVMAVWTWRTWPDLLIDFGREAYVAWRLSEGAVLHRDVVSVSGPLSAYWNALLFRVFGVGLDTLFAANAVVFAALVVVWARLLEAVADRFAAWAGSLVLVALFGFSQYVGIGNYNYIAPYAHEMPHGLLFASLGLLCWRRVLADGARGAWLGAGVALGLVALTKMEVLVAAVAANAVGLLALGLARDPKQRSPRLDAAGLSLFGAGVVAPVAVAVAALAGPLGLSGALRAVGIGWVRLLGDDLAGLPFYQRGMGVDDWLGNTTFALQWAARIAGVLAPAALLAFALRERRFAGGWLALAAGAAMALALAPFVAGVPWLQAARPLPFFGLFAVGYCALRLLRARGGPGFARAALQAMAVVLATLLMAKIFFLGRIYQYGFVLGMPAALLFVAALVAWIPGEITRRGGRGTVFRGAALGVLAVAIAGHWLVMAPYVEAKSARVGGLHDGIRVQPGVARVINRTLATVGARTRPGDSLAVLPEGVMLNFLTRHPTPTPHFSFNPFELHVYGEEQILRDFRSAPPAAIVLVHHDTSEHGARFLGRNYGVELMRWIRSHYETAAQIGDPPLEPGTRFGVAVLERTHPAPR